jgi:putative N6-adenine-specific DNA methylase
VLLHFFAPCPRGLEDSLVTELRGLGAGAVSSVPGGVHFEGDAVLGMAVNLHSRLASRVLQRVARGAYRSEEDLYRLSHDTPWEQWHAPTTSLRIDVNAIGAPLKSLQFAMLRIKDGLVDRLRERFDERPSIERQRPDRRVFAFLDPQECLLYLDWSGESLFKRGWRRDAADAPLKENLASGLLTLSGWTPEQPLLDPFCGSGTIAIEAALQAAGVAPGARRRFGFERMKDFDRARWDRMRATPTRPVPASPPIFASDVSAAAIAAARANYARTGLPDGWVQWRQLDALHIDAAPAPSGLMLTNPPYGERLEIKGRQSLAQADAFWPALGTLLKQRFAGWSVALFTSDLEVPQRLRLKPARRTPLFNGALECRLFRFEMVAGSARRPQTIPSASVP